jgi:hypothetical protein
VPPHPPIAWPDPHHPPRPAAGPLERLRSLRSTYHDGHAVVVNLGGLPLVAARPALHAVAQRELGTIARRLGLTTLDVPGAAVLLCQPAALDQLEVALARLARVFGWQGRPVIGHPGEHTALPALRFDLGRAADETELQNHLTDGETAAAAGIAAGTAPGSAVPPLTPRDVTRIGDRIADVALEPLIRRQHALELAPAALPRPLLCETYVSIAALAAAVAPGVDLLAEPLLFRSLTGILDQRMLRALARPQPATPGALSLNLNIPSLASAAFSDLERAWPPSRRPLIEIQLGEILTHAATYPGLRADLRRRGCGIVIDGVRADALAMVALERLEPDLVKVLWGRAGRADVQPLAGEAIAGRIRSIGAGRVILAHTESEDALRWGLSLGITRFQGFFIDRLARAIDLEPGA